jgi:opacity protein-like surface antigen
MKRVLLVAAMSVFVISALTAQVVIKPSAGVNFTDFSKNQSNGEFRAKPGYQVGGSVAFGKKVYIEPGLFYVRKSTQFRSTTEGTDNIDYNISGIRIPLAVGAHFIGNEKSPVSLRGFAGASAFIMTRIEDLDKEDFNRAAWGAFAGLGLDLSVVFFEAKYEWSLTNLKKDITQIDVGKSRTIFLNAGVRLAL